LVVVGLYATAIFWITSQRSRVVPTTLLVGTVSGLVLGLVMYVVAPLGLSKEATNPWLPGSDIDPLAFLAWMLVLFGPCIAGGVAYLRYMASKDPPPAKRDQARQAVVAGLLANLVGALLVTVLGNGTVALMINAPWLRNWLYHGRHLLYGVAGLQPVLRGHPGAIAYSHEITAVTDAGAFSAICISFLLIAAVAGGFVAMCVLVEAPAEPGNPRRGEGDPPGTEPEPPDGGQMTRAVDYEVESALGVLRLDDRGLSSDQDGPVVRVPDDAVEPVGSR
jgi:hypothetical protein